MLRHPFHALTLHHDHTVNHTVRAIPPARDHEDQGRHTLTFRSSSRSDTPQPFGGRSSSRSDTPQPFGGGVLGAPVSRTTTTLVVVLAVSRTTTSRVNMYVRRCAWSGQLRTWWWCSRLVVRQTAPATPVVSRMTLGWIIGTLHHHHVLIACRDHHTLNHHTV